MQQQNTHIDEINHHHHHTNRVLQAQQLWKATTGNQTVPNNWVPKLLMFASHIEATEPLIVSCGGIPPNQAMEILIVYDRLKPLKPCAERVSLMK